MASDISLLVSPRWAWFRPATAPNMNTMCHGLSFNYRLTGPILWIELNEVKTEGTLSYYKANETYYTLYF